MDKLIGKKIVAIRRLTDKELENEGWNEFYVCARTSVAIVLDDGTTLFASSDEEGNGPGVIFGSNTTILNSARHFILVVD